MHPLHSRCDDVEHPDYLFFDLDPFPPYTYEDVLIVARHIKALLDQLGLTGYPKTSGATGLQIYLPIERGAYTYGQVRAFVGACGRLITRADPDRVDDGVEDRRPHRQDLHRPQHEPRRARTSRPPTRCGPSARALALHAAHVGRGDGGRVRAAGLPDRQRVGAVRARRRPVRAGARGTGERPRRTRSRRSTSTAEDEDPIARPLPRTAAASVAVAHDVEEIAAASKDPEADGVRAPARLRGHPRAGARRRSPSRDGNSFVIHKHRATALHYDVRLERDGALPSWAVPKGLPTAKGDKRLAVRTEDHPLEYGLVRGHDPRGPLRRGRGPDLRRRLVRAGRVDRRRRSRSGCTGAATRASSSTS